LLEKSSEETLLELIRVCGSTAVIILVDDEEDDDEEEGGGRVGIVEIGTVLGLTILLKEDDETLLFNVPRFINDWPRKTVSSAIKFDDVDDDKDDELLGTEEIGFLDDAVIA